MDKVLLDTDILSEILKGKNPQVTVRENSYLEAYGRFSTTSLTVLEIVKGLKKVNREDRIVEFEANLATMDVLPLDGEAGVLAGRIFADLERSGQPIGRIDPMIAAISIKNSLALITGNRSHYERVVEIGYPLRLEDWRV